MEQPIGPKVPPTHAAGVDPAYVPGLLPPRPPADAAPAREAVADEVKDAPEAAPAADAGTAPDEPADARPAADAEPADGDAAPAADAVDGALAGQPAEEAEEEPEDDGKPVFEVSDRRGAIVADRDGVTFRLDGEVAEFGWDEIQAVEIDTPRFGRRFGVTVYTSTRRWFQSDVEAPSRAELKAWTARLDEVLDARFEEGGEPEQAEDTDQVEDAEAGPESAATDDATDAATDDATEAAASKGAQAKA
ncbi:hypothetical protein V2S66_32370 [Streptomyces sp. V4-01]|uniref:Uncharacterized protein n=1 Tax=Actinacidiphila polyblastidii TaxID=3110430 RepID=A0ABU7PLD2_9ACTN|nr:hypothetical protein [Streptomyces sp. V4-01]